jgi:2-C-methyl-D-erythritol 4-phosphate cytidylyltransferase
VPDPDQTARERVWTIVVAGGSGQRFGGRKQFADLGGRLVLDWAVAAAQSASEGVVVVLPADVADVDATDATDATTVTCPAVRTVRGGSSRSASVRHGLGAVPDDAEVICVHDAARPFAGADTFAAVIAAVRAGADGAVPAVVVTDTIKVVDDAGTVLATPDRATLRAVQTPQAFAGAVLRRAHAAGRDGTDDAALVEALGGRVVVVAGDPANRKLTEPADLAWARERVAEVRS